ncbi:VOC family protein [Allonocardiopsis opalescens]|uniref:PhnB protein n=1 Tax=Allonocardiopsis opalescens TaxID=1144618 RepID=A0A2T0Q9B6_9ACTN|nr:VOC family protein [Allonocardiopsis opalescens]PRY00486.1 PhnB protein [Allonocardiopsis opalescens]
MNETATPSISPFLFCADVPASLDFAARAFGLAPDEPRPGPDGTVTHASARLGRHMVYFSAPHEDAMVPPKRLPALHALVMMYVADVDAVFEQARAAGATVEYPPTDMPYDRRECGVRDLDGHLWSIATPLPPGT